MKYLLASVLLLGIGIGLFASAVVLYPYSEPEIYWQNEEIVSEEFIVRVVYFHMVNFPPVHLGMIGLMFISTGLLGILFSPKSQRDKSIGETK